MNLNLLKQMTILNEIPNQETKRWTTSVDEEGVLTLPGELLDALGWKEGDEINFIDRKDGSFVLEKIDEAAA